MQVSETYINTKLTGGYIMKQRFVLLLTMIILIVNGSAWADLSSGLVTYYPFSGNANDASGYGYNGTVYGATLTTDRFGNQDSAYNFDGIDDYIDFGNGASTLFDSSDSFTLAAWIKHSASSTFSTILARSDDNYQTFNYLMGVSNLSNGKLTFMADQAHVDSNWLKGTTNLATDTWYHVVSVYDNKNMTVYVNGQQNGSGIFPAGGVGDSTANLYVGKTGQWPGYPDDRYFTGVIDEVRIYNRALTGSEVYDLSIVPVPSAVILGGLGLTFSGWLLHRRRG